ncbi:MAG TPA: hypothetical protein VK892_06360 [Pyrinomonadaceae bacterium]|nr:hypothetical protein [Pyrinomonadaceae bacterium]
MNIKNRLKRIEQINQVNSQFCGCGTSYYRDVIKPNEPLTNETCPQCEKPVRPQTLAEFASGIETEVILPGGETI